MRTWLSPIALLVAACSATTSNATPASSAPRADPEPPNARVHVSAHSSFGLRSTGVLASVSRLEHLGPRRFVFGGWRVELADGDRALVSEDAFLSTVSDAQRCGDGWVFVTWRGTIGYSETFTGPAHRIGTVAWLDSDPRHRLRTHEGLVFHTDDRGGVLAGPCAGPLQAIDVVPGDIVGDVWGAGPRRLAIVGGRQLYRSEDEGRTWSRVAIVGGVPRAIARDGSVEVAEDRWVRVDRTGAAVSAETPSADDRSWVIAREPAEPMIEGGEGRASAALLRQRAAARAALRPLVADGSLVVLDGSRLRVVAPAADTRSLELPRDAGCRPSLTWLGRRPLVLCAELAVILDGAHSLREVATPPGAIGRYVLAADDGAQLAFRGTCRGEPGEDAHCLVNVDTGAARDLTLPPRSELIALHGDHAVLMRRMDDDYELARLDVRSGRLEAFQSATGFRWPTVAGRVEADGAFLGVLMSGTDRPRLVRHDASGLASPDLPPNASHVGFVDARFGVAAGETSDELWVTEDGARSWRPLPAPFEASVSLRYLPNQVLPAHLDCDPAGCSVGAVWVERGAPIGSPPGWIVPGDRAEPAAQPLAPGSLELACRVESATEATSDGATVPGSRDLDTLEVVSEAPPASADVRIERSRAGPVLVWSGEDEEGAFTSRTRPWRVAPTARDLHCDGLAVLRARALLRCCWSEEVEPDYREQRCLGVAAAAGGEITDLGGTDVYPEDVLQVGERILVLDAVSSIVFAIDDVTGPLRAWRWPPRVDTGNEERDLVLDLATVDGAPVLLRQLRRVGGHTAFLERLDEDTPAIPVVLPSRHRISVCSESMRGGVELPVDEVRLRWPEDGPRPFSGPLRVTVRLDGERTCIRAVQNEVGSASLRAAAGRCAARSMVAQRSSRAALRARRTTASMGSATPTRSTSPTSRTSPTRSTTSDAVSGPRRAPARRRRRGLAPRGGSSPRRRRSSASASARRSRPRRTYACARPCDACAGRRSRRRTRRRADRRGRSGARAPRRGRAPR